MTIIHVILGAIISYRLLREVDSDRSYEVTDVENLVFPRSDT